MAGSPVDDLVVVHVVPVMDHDGPEIDKDEQPQVDEFL